MSDGNDIYGELDLAILRSQVANIKSVASILGISEKALAGAFIEEINEWNVNDAERYKNGVLDAITPGWLSSNASILENYQYIKQVIASGGDPRDLGFGIQEDFDKITVKLVSD
jgi:hypothetical protein